MRSVGAKTGPALLLGKCKLEVVARRRRAGTLDGAVGSRAVLRLEKARREVVDADADADVNVVAADKDSARLSERRSMTVVVVDVGRERCGGASSLSEDGGEEEVGCWCWWRGLVSGSSRRKETEARISARLRGFWKARERRSLGGRRLILSGRESWRGRWGRVGFASAGA